MVKVETKGRKGVQTTPAQARFLGDHTDKFNYQHQRGKYPEGFRPSYLADRGGKPYDFVGRCRDAGLITIENNVHTGWPYSWAGTWLTAAGFAALHMEVPADYKPKGT